MWSSVALKWKQLCFATFEESFLFDASAGFIALVAFCSSDWRIQRLLMEPTGRAFGLQTIKEDQS